jgi:pimeloyl-ACP methyl ester carboxylesterase
VGPVIHLAHANGFPPATYEPLTAALIGNHHVIGLPARPLWPSLPGIPTPDSVPTWHPLAGDLIAALDDLGLSDIVGVGHSLGGVLTMWAAIQRPDLFRAVVLIDPVILPPSRLRALRLLRLVRLQHRLPIAQAAMRRRRTWPTRQACYDHLVGKPFFARWPAASLEAYVKAGTRETIDPHDGVELVYPPEWEAHIFATTPTGIWRDIPRLRTPVLAMRGEHSPTFPAESLARLARLLPHACTLTIPDSDHMVPVERPAETAASILDFIEHSLPPAPHK